MSISSLRKAEVIFNLVTERIEQKLKSGEMTIEEMLESAEVFKSVKYSYDYEIDHQRDRGTEVF